MYCFNRCNNHCMRFIGIVLIVVGAVLVLCFTPGWLWCALIGIIMIVVGIVILVGDC